MPQPPEITTSSIRVPLSASTLNGNHLSSPDDYGFIKVTGHASSQKEVQFEIPWTFFNGEAGHILRITFPVDQLKIAIERATTLTS